MVSSTLLTLIILPVLYFWLRQHSLRRDLERGAPAPKAAVAGELAGVGEHSDGPRGSDRRAGEPRQR